MTRRRLALWVAAGALAAAAVVAVVGRNRHRATERSELVRTVDGDGLELIGVTARPLHAVVGQRVRLAVEVEHGRAASGQLRYLWEAKSGAFEEDATAAVVWIATGKPGRRKIQVAVEDGARTVRGEVTIEVRLPSARELASLDDLLRTHAAEVDADAARMAAVDGRLAELARVAARGDTISDLLRAQEALEEMATLLEEAGRYEDARAVWDRLLVNMLPGASKHAAFNARLGDVAFMLGDDDAALAAWDAGGVYTDSMSRYYQGQILERRGDRQGALAAYAAAEGGMHWFGDPVYRRALLMLETGADRSEVADLLVEASARLDRDRMLERFTSDPEAAPLRRLLEDTGRMPDLVAQQPMTLELAGPGEGAAPGGG